LPIAEQTVEWVDCAPVASQLRATVAKLNSAYPDETTFIRALDAAVGLDTGFLMRWPAIAIPAKDGIGIAVFYPYPRYRVQLLEALRKREPVGSVPMPTPAISIIVAPSRIDAPDIIKIVLECRFSEGRDPGFSKPFPPEISSADRGFRLPQATCRCPV
jgi:hypothetical protein